MEAPLEALPIEASIIEALMGVLTGALLEALIGNMALLKGTFFLHNKARCARAKSARKNPKSASPQSASPKSASPTSELLTVCFYILVRPPPPQIFSSPCRSSSPLASVSGGGGWWLCSVFLSVSLGPVLVGGSRELSVRGWLWLCLSSPFGWCCGNSAGGNDLLQICY